MIDNRGGNLDGKSNFWDSFAWGELFVGSIISGFALWKLLLRAWNLPPSQLLAGLSSTYDEVRDFLMSPFLLFQVHLTGGEKNCIVISAVLTASVVRASRRHRAALVFLVGPIFVFLVLGMAGASVLLSDLMGNPQVSPKVADSCSGDICSWLSAVRTSIDAIFNYVREHPLSDVRDSIRIPFEWFFGFVTVYPLFGLVDRENRPIVAAVFSNYLATALWGVALLLLNWATS